MGICLTDQRKKAAKDHRCISCDQTIPNAAVYNYSSGINDGSWWTWREHLPCRDVTMRWLSNEPDGLDPSEFSIADIAMAIANGPELERASAVGYFRKLGITAMVEAIAQWQGE